MVYLRQILSGRTTPILILLVLLIQVESSKIAYKKPIQSKLNSIKEKDIKSKLNEETKTTTTTKSPLIEHLIASTPTAISSTKSLTTTAKTSTVPDELEVAETTHAIKAEQLLDVEAKETEIKDIEEKQQIVEENESNIEKQNNTSANNSLEFKEAALSVENFEDNKLDSQQIDEKPKNIPLDWEASKEHAAVEEPPNSKEFSTASITTTTEKLATSRQTEETLTPTTEMLTKTTTTTTMATTTTTTDVAPTTQSKRPTPTPCTCGVFMTSQIKRTGNPYEPPIGRPVIMNELDRTYPCNAVGQKQCQTKCLEAIIQHLPNSANILCASLDHDIRKERAYLFIKNCRNQWFNTNLAAGREYCCKNGQPYQCPFV